MQMRGHLIATAAAALLSIGPITAAQAQRLPLTQGVAPLCTIDFGKDPKFPARVGDAALPCLEQAAKTLAETPSIKLVLVCIAHPLYDHAEKDRGMEREDEDMTGTDLRFSDLAAYRAIRAGCQRIPARGRWANCRSSDRRP